MTEFVRPFVSIVGKEIDALSLKCRSITKCNHYRRVHSASCITAGGCQSFLNNSACNKWGNELTRKSYSHLSKLCKEGDAAISMATLGCRPTELCPYNAPPRLKDWWGIFVDPSEDGSEE